MDVAVAAVGEMITAALALYRAPFWTPAQRSFLKEEIIDDADWAGVIDELNARLS